MRLTLRTLLAYLDSLLEPKDADELSKKIEESEYATSLVHRIRDAMRRLRLGAPSLTDRGPGLDPNTVAEYLDNTLISERVSDFEKVCLDSDIHLAEVASCHQILTLVLGEPAEVDPAGRQQMYQLIEAAGQVAPPLPRSVEKPPALPGATTPPQLDLGELGPAERKARPKPTVPEYLREPRRKPAWVSIAAAAVLVVCVTVIVLKSLGQFKPEAPLGKLLVSLGVIAAPPPPEVAAVSEGERRATEPPRAEKPAPKAVQPPATESGKAPEKPPAVQPPKGPSGQSAEQPGKPAIEGPAKQPPEAPKAAPPLPTLPGPAVPPAGPGKEPAVPPLPGPPPMPEPGPKSLPKLPPMPGIEEEKEKPPDAQPAPQPPAPQAEAMGRLMSSDQVLLGRDAAGEWTRVTNQMLVPQQVLVLPTYRAKVALTVGVTLEVLGGTRLELLGTTPPLPPGIGIWLPRNASHTLVRPGTWAPSR